MSGVPPYRNAPPTPPTHGGGASVGLTRSHSPSLVGGINGVPGQATYNHGTASTSAIGLTPDNGSGYAAGISQMMVKENVDMALEAQGLSTNAVQVGILRAKVQGLQSELMKARHDGKEAAEKLTAASSKLNAEKIQNSSLLHKQNALMAKLSEAEANERELEEALVGEKKAHNATREAFEKLRNNRDDLEVALQNTKDALQRLQSSVGNGDNDRCRDRTLYIPTSEHIDMQEKFRKAHDQLLEQVKSSFERIAQTQDEDETALFISRSAVLSSATDLETKLCHSENMLELLKGTMDRFTREFEEDSGRMMLSLMNENKELWTTVSKQQFELDRANAEIAARGRRDDYVHKDQVDYLNKTIVSLEDRLKKSQDAIEAQTDAARTHAERMRDVLDENNALRRHLTECEQDLQSTRDALAAKDLEADDLSSQNKSFQIQVQDLTKANQHLQSQIASLTTELRSARDTLENETRSTIRQLQNERNDAIDAANRLRSDLEDANQRLVAVERDLEVRQAAFNNARQDWEVQHNGVVNALQEELASTRGIFENELEEMRRDLVIKDDEVRRCQKELESLRLDQQNRNGTARAIEDARAQLERELASAKSALTRAEERSRKLSTECDQFRNSSITFEGRVQTLTAENIRLQAQVTQLENSLSDERNRFHSQNDHLEREWAESERTRTTLIEEITKLRAKANEDGSLKALKERMEKEKELLMAENVRIHQQYQDVQQGNVTLQQQLTQLKGKLSGIGQLSQQLEDVQRRLSELPALRQQAEEARREAVRLKEEMEMLRRERDEMSQRLEFFLEEARVNAKKDTDLDRLFREASNQVRRLDQQIDEVTHRQPAGEAILPASSSRHASMSPHTAAINGYGNNNGTPSGLNLPPHPTSSSVYGGGGGGGIASSVNSYPPLRSTSASGVGVNRVPSSRVEDVMASHGAASNANGSLTGRAGLSPTRQPWH